MMGRTSALLGAAMLALGLLAAVPAAADVPMKLTHQGRILDDAGAAVTGSADLAFTLYDAATGGATVWSDQQTVDLGTGGFYSVELGDASSPINEAVLASSEVWLGLAINGGAELSPRIQLTSVPYAVNANQALTVVPGAITTASIADGAVTSTQLASVPWQKLTNIPTGLDDGDADVVGGLSCATGDVAQYNGTAWACAAMSGYTDADAIAAVGAHYTDSDAVAAVGAHYNDANALAYLGTESVQHDDSRLSYLPAVAGDCAVGTGLWCTATNSWGENRFSTHGRYTQCVNDTDCSSASITLDLTGNQYRTVYMSHLDWTNTREFDVYISYNGGANYEWHKKFQTYRKVGGPAAGRRTSTVRTIATNLPLGRNIRVRVQATRGRMHFDGFGLSKLVAGENVPNSNTSVTYEDEMGDWRNALTGGNARPSDTWVDIPERTLTFNKQTPRSLMRISYTDTLGTYGTGYAQCRWRILVDGVERQYFSTADITLGLAWRMAHATHSVIVPGLGTGDHTVTVQNYRTAAGTECLTGWNTTHNQLVAEELN